jgi:hypothetical protein
MTLHIYRVLVRGRFDELDPNVRAALVAGAADHDVVLAEFTTTGTLTYEPAVTFFTFRVEVRASGDDPAAAATAAAKAKAVEYLSTRSIGYRDLSVLAADMADVWRD